MNIVSIKKIENIAKEIGIEEIGFTDTIDFSYLSESLKCRLKENKVCEFEETDVSLRTNTRSVMKDCKSIIACIFPYFDGYAVANKFTYGNICSSSAGIDYHTTVKKKLEEFAEKIKKYREFSYKVCVDSSYLLDKEICKNAGLGYIGKNSLLINKKYGSFVFLGYILTDIEFSDGDIDSYTADKLPLDSCGECKACINNCPNNALSMDGRMNVKKCISYLTQTKEYIPVEYRRKMSCQIYGCDVCQLICPKNKAIYGEFFANDDLYVSIEEILTISKKEFAKKYGHLAAAWRGKNIWKRNAIIIAANTNRLDLYDLIKTDIDNPSDMISHYAKWCIEEMDRIKYEKNNR